MPQTNSTVVGDSKLNRDSKVNFNIGHLGLVVPRVNDSKRWKVVTFAIGYNRLSNFNRNTFYNTQRRDGGIGEHFAALSQGTNVAALDTNDIRRMAFDTYIIDTIGGSTNYRGPVDSSNTILERKQNIEARGGHDEMTISLAGNYDNRLSLGATIGIPFISYIENKTYEERDLNGTDTNFRNLLYKQNLDQTGTGVNLKLGAILRATQWLRVGAAFHTPTIYGITDIYGSELSALTVQSQVQNTVTSSGKYKYSLITPSRAIGSLSLVSAQGRMGDKTVSGFLNGEVEYVDYSNMRFIFDRTSGASDKDLEVALNNAISTKYQSALNYRIGAELAYDIFRVRAGYALLGSPFKANISGINRDIQQISFGAGIRERKIAFDIAYVQSTGRDEYTPYLSSLPSAIDVRRSLNDGRFVATLSFKF